MAGPAAGRPGRPDRPARRAAATPAAARIGWRSRGPAAGPDRYGRTRRSGPGRRRSGGPGDRSGPVEGEPLGAGGRSGRPPGSCADRGVVGRRVGGQAGPPVVRRPPDHDPVWFQRTRPVSRSTAIERICSGEMTRTWDPAAAMPGRVSPAPSRSIGGTGAQRVRGQPGAVLGAGVQRVADQVDRGTVAARWPRRVDAGARRHRHDRTAATAARRGPPASGGPASRRALGDGRPGSGRGRHEAGSWYGSMHTAVTVGQGIRQTRIDASIRRQTRYGRRRRRSTARARSRRRSAGPAEIQGGEPGPAARGEAEHGGPEPVRGPARRVPADQVAPQGAGTGVADGQPAQRQFTAGLAGSANSA